MVALVVDGDEFASSPIRTLPSSLRIGSRLVSNHRRSRMPRTGEHITPSRKGHHLRASESRRLTSSWRDIDKSIRETPFVSNASCTHNVSYRVKVIRDNFGVRHGSMLTFMLHNYQQFSTASQGSHTRTRAALSIIPHYNGRARPLRSSFPSSERSTSGHRVRHRLSFTISPGSG